MTTNNDRKVITVSGKVATQLDYLCRYFGDEDETVSYNTAIRKTIRKADLWNDEINEEYLSKKSKKNEIKSKKV